METREVTTPNVSFPTLVTTMIPHPSNPRVIVVTTDYSVWTLNLENLNKTLIAGSSGTSGYNEGFGSAARFNNLKGSAEFNQTTVLVVDRANHCLRTVSLISGSTQRYAGVCQSYGSNDGYRTSVNFHFPRTMAKTGSTFYINDYNNRKIRKLDGNIVSTLVSLSYRPLGLSWNGEKFFYSFRHGVGDSQNSVITGSSSSGFSDGSLNSARFNNPYDVLAVTTQVFLVADRSNRAVRLGDYTKQTVSTLNITNSRWSNPHSLMILNGSVYVGTKSARIFKFPLNEIPGTPLYQTTTVRVTGQTIATTARATDQIISTRTTGQNASPETATTTTTTASTTELATALETTPTTTLTTSTHLTTILINASTVQQYDTHNESQTVRSGQHQIPNTPLSQQHAQCRKENSTVNIGSDTMESCLNFPQNIAAKRYCLLTRDGLEAYWSDLDTTRCPTEHTGRLRDILNNFNDSRSSEDRLRPVRSVNSALNSSSSASLGAPDVRLINDILERSLESATPSTEDADEYLTTFNTIFSANASTLKAANDVERTVERMIQNIEKFTGAIKLGPGQKNWTSESGNLYIHIVDVDAEANLENGYNATVSDIPVTIPSEALVKSSNSRLQFMKFKQPTMFEVIEGSEVFSPVLSISIGKKNISNLNNPVYMRLKSRSTLLSNQTAMCYYWDWSSNSWSSDGVRTRHEGNATVCESDHLTNFALLMNVNPYNSGSVTEEHQKILSIISYIGCSISLISLIITLFIYIMFRPLRKDNPSKILMNLCSALLLLNLVFLSLTHVKDTGIICKITGVLLHYSLLASFSWMAVESFYMYISLILVFSYIRRFMLKAMLVGWGVPLLIVVITLAISPDNYQLYQNQICWLKEEAFFGAALGPIGVIIVINIIIFVMIVKKLINVNNRRHPEKNMDDQRKKISKNIQGAVTVFVLLGLTWVFAGLLVFKDNLVFNYLFSICNSLQGFFLFIFYCVLKKEVKVVLRSYLAAYRKNRALDRQVNDSTAPIIMR